MTNDASTAYICIYCPFNSDNLEALENHLTSAHGHGCQDAPSLLTQSSPSSNIINKASKREAPDDEQPQSSLNGIKSTKEHSSGIKRVKRTVSPSTPTNIFINGADNNSESDDDHEYDDDDDDDDNDDEDEDDERDSSSNPTTMSPKAILTCPICSSTYHRLGHLLRHAKRKHHTDLSNYDGQHTFENLTSQVNQIETSEIEINSTSKEQINLANTEDIEPSEKASQQQNETISPLASETNATTDCPYCDYKTTDIEQFKLHIIAHIRDKNYRCLLCNRLYKYRGMIKDVLFICFSFILINFSLSQKKGDCSFHIRRKHHRYSTNSNDYIQRFLFDTTEGDESMSKQSGGQHGTSMNSSVHNINTVREQDEPVRYFGCPYCDYTSNYGGDVRKHQARKHPNVESKVIKIIRQDSEHQMSLSNNNHNNNPHNISNDDAIDDDNHDQDETNTITKSNINLIEQQERKEKIKTIKKTDANFIQQHSSTLSILPNFAPVRVFQCSSCHQQGTYKWVVERHIRAKHPEQPDVHVIELPAELAVKLQKITPPLKRFRCSLCPLQSKHTWVIIRHIKHFHTLQTASVLDIQPDGTPINDESYSLQNGDFSNKSYHQDSESSSVSSSCMETGTDGQNDLFRQQDVEDDDDENDNIRSSLNPNSNNTMILTYKCSLCEFTSNVPWNVQKHINDLHPGQSNAHMLTQCRSAINDKNQKLLTKKSKHKSGNQTTIATVTKIPIRAPLSPTTALAKAKFSPAVEEALLSLQGSKLNAGLYAVQPKFGIKRLKCRHCFYRSNWKTDMIRHVRIRHNLTEPDHNKDMILMSEQEARATIETYENTFGKELRRRTFRTWNDWAKAEEEFTPKDGSLQYSNINSGTLSDDNNKPKKNPVITGQTILSSTTTTNDEIKRINKTKVKHASKTITQNNIQPLLNTKEFKQLPNPSNIVSRLLLTTSPSQNNDDDAPLDLSLKSSSTIKPNQQSLSSKEIIQQNGDINNQEKQYMDDDLDDEDEEENSDGTSTVTYICSVCPYKSSSLSSVQHHLIIHLTGQGVICPLCSYATSSPNSMIRHMKIVHPTSQTIIEFQSATRITNANIIEQHQCPLCPHQCERSEALDLHRRLEHDDEEFDIDSSSDTGDVDNEDGMESDDIQMQFDKNNNLFQCPVCTPSSNTNNYSNLEQFTMHVFTNHINYMHNNQSCPFCSFIAHTTSKYSLTEHIKLHFNGTLVQPDPIVGIENVKELLIE
ncbi:unnamed protein product [Rotaria sp. Silwood2]|nr:unnamed protein product [Rotaria sp. Silwood2]CAF2473535.1 unnamed protein product [Rotaria sp. Silwood2]CAF2860311.1 unnamed protein product [Rotaria sp. Silwood2]CAF3903816.1 unnamed protein product [Rotaria sp. Silwood2]